jgi:hypothetical protein
MIDLEVKLIFFFHRKIFLFFIKAVFDKLDHELKEINTNADALLRNYNELTELKYNLSMTQTFFEEVILDSLMLCY